MTTEEKKQLKALIVTTSLYYGRQLDDVVILMQTKDLEDLPFRQIVDAFNKYRRDAANKFAPLPAAIRAMVNPSLSRDQEALEASKKIVEAMGKFGYLNPDKARNFMGPIAWEVVQREGGWPQLCQRTKNDDLPILGAQFRELAKVVIVRQMSLPKEALPSPEQKSLEVKDGES